MAKTAKELLTEAKLDKTYWGKKIIAAEKRGEFASGEVKLAAEWPTCACGKQDKRIPRNGKGEPNDGDLFSDGVNFGWKVFENNPYAAAQLLIRIECRAKAVLAKVLAKEAAVAEASQ